MGIYTPPYQIPILTQCQQTSNGLLRKFLKPISSRLYKYAAFSSPTFLYPVLTNRTLTSKMKQYHTFPNCMDVILNDSDGSEHLSTKVLHRHAGLYSSFSFPSWWPVDESHMYAFAEAASSPAKYSTFQILGCKTLQRFGYLDISTTLSSSARVGAVGGTVLTLVYFALLFARKDQIQAESTTILSFSSYALLLSKEMTYSAIAAIIGAVAKGLYSPHALSTHAIAGVLGPILFLLLLFGGLGLVMLFVWTIERFKDWYSGY